MNRQNWKKYIVVAAVFLAALFFLAFTNPVNADDSMDEFRPEHGIPLMIIRIDESKEGIEAAKEKDPEHKYGTIRQMNNSSDHSVRCKGTAELKVPEGYTGGYASLPYAGTTGEMELSYIRGRGNGSWFGAKKPYKLKLDKKQDLLGMGKSKEWALLAERMDPTLMKNRITFELGEEMGLSYTPRLVPIEVVMVGSKSGAEYLGVYNLAETIKLEKSRIDLSEPEEDATEEEGKNNITGSYIVSLFNSSRDQKEPESNRFFTNQLDGLFGFLNKEPEYTSEDLTEAQKKQREYIRNYITDTENLIMSSDYIDHDLHMQIAERMDLQSAADYWWIQIFSRNPDAFYTSSTYMYKVADGKLYWGPLWDFDTAWGRIFMFSNSLVTEGFDEFVPFPWFTHLRECDPEFVKLLKERWQILDEKLAALTAKGGSLDRYRDEVAEAQAADYQKWSSVPGLTFYYAARDYGATVEKLRTFIEKRRAWVNANLDSVGSFLSVSFDAGEGEGDMEDILNVKAGETLKLPACAFVSKQNSCLKFDSWQIDGRQYQEGETVIIQKDTTVKAVWKTEHSWKEADCTNPRTCTGCGRQEGKPRGHNWDNGKVTKEASCTKEGEKTFTCSSCKQTKTEKIAAAGHRYQTKITKATPERNGSVVEKCSVCGNVKSSETISSPGTFRLDKSAFTYNGSVQKPASVIVKDSSGNLIDAKNYKIIWANKNSRAAGSYTVTIRFKGNKYSGSRQLTYQISKAANPLKVNVEKKTFRATALKKNKATFAIGAKKNSGKVTYTLNAAAKKAGIKVTDKGKVTVPKNCKAGTYKITVKAAGNKNYKAGKKTVTIVVF